MNEPIFSIILPIHNQEEDVVNIIQEYENSLSRINESFELIIIINGSDDMSYQKGKAFALGKKRIKVFQIIEKGWGRAVKYGLLKASGQFIGYTNSARTNIDDLIRIMKFVKTNNNVVVKASRLVRDSFLRKLGSTIYNIECRLLFKTAIWDVNGTPKFFHKKVFENIKLQSDGDLIDAEFIAKCTEKKIPIVGVPVLVNTRRSGKSTTTLLSALKMYVGLILLKIRMDTYDKN